MIRRFKDILNEQNSKPNVDMIHIKHVIENIWKDYPHIKMIPEDGALKIKIEKNGKDVDVITVPNNQKGLDNMYLYLKGVELGVKSVRRVVSEYDPYGEENWADEN